VKLFCDFFAHFYPGIRNLLYKLFLDGCSLAIRNQTDREGRIFSLDVLKFSTFKQLDKVAKLVYMGFTWFR